MTGENPEPRLTSLAHGGGCGCKLSPAMLEALLGGAPLGPMPAELLVDASTRDDAAVYRLSETAALVATLDFFTPIVDDPYAFGQIAATNALSDVYAMGGRPILSLAICGMPLSTLAPATMAAILAGGRAVAAAAGAPVAGGHSIDAAEPIYGLAALGLVHPDMILTNAGARAGDVLVLGKPLGVGVFSAALKRGSLAAADYATMLASATRLNTPGPELAALAGVRAGTDVTGFGLLGHLSAMAAASGVRAALDVARVPVFPGARALAEQGVRTGASLRNWEAVRGRVSGADAISVATRDLLCDPQTSGGLLIACAPEAAEAALAVFARHGHDEAALIGRVEAGEGIGLA